MPGFNLNVMANVDTAVERFVFPCTTDVRTDRSVHKTSINHPEHGACFNLNGFVSLVRHVGGINCVRNVTGDLISPWPHDGSYRVTISVGPCPLFASGDNTLPGVLPPRTVWLSGTLPRPTIRGCPAAHVLRSRCAIWTTVCRTTATPGFDCSADLPTLDLNKNNITRTSKTARPDGCTIVRTTQLRVVVYERGG